MEFLKNYVIHSLKKTATVSPNGYGRISFESCITVEDSDFVGPVHYFGLSNSVPHDLVLPSIERLCLGSPIEGGIGPFMNYRLLSPKDQTISMVATELSAQSTERIRAVLFEMTPPCPSGQKIVYAWQWGFPHLYNTAPEEEDSSGFRCTVLIECLSLDIRFLHPRIGALVKFKEEPILTTTRTQTDAKTRKQAKAIETLNYLSYKWTIEEARAGDQYVVGWRNA